MARRLNKLVDLIVVQGWHFLKDRGIDLDSRLFSAVLFLSRRGPCSITELATALGLSHQLTTYRIKALVRDGLAESRPNPDDHRQQTIQLTAQGKALEPHANAALIDVATAHEGLFDDIGANLFELARSALARSTSFFRRNLYPLIIAHAAVDVLGMTIMFMSEP